MSWFFPLELSLRSKRFRSRFCAKDGEIEREKEQNKKKKKERKKEELLPLHSSFLFLINLLQDSCKGKITAINQINKYNYPFEFFFFVVFINSQTFSTKAGIDSVSQTIDSFPLSQREKQIVFSVEWFILS